MYLVLAIITVLSACTRSPKTQNKSSTTITQQDKDLMVKAQSVFTALPTSADNNPDNPVTPEKVKLGKALYFEKKLSLNKTQSCNTCHNLATYGVDNLPTSPGDNGKPGTRNSPTTFNAALRGAQFWDGRNKDVEEQAGGPVMNPAEMGMPDKKVVVDRLNDIEAYREMFKSAFPEQETPVSFKNMQKAIGAFERTLITHGPFDKYLSGDYGALSKEQKKGLIAFLDNGCVSCHGGPLLGGSSFMKVGLFGDYHSMMKAVVKDEGRYEATGKESDKGIFYTPGLRNVAKTAPYFHNGMVNELQDAIKIIGKIQLNRDINDADAKAISAFLESLTGDIPKEIKQEPVINN